MVLQAELNLQTAVKIALKASVSSAQQRMTGGSDLCRVCFMLEPVVVPPWLADESLPTMGRTKMLKPTASSEMSEHLRAGYFCEGAASQPSPCPAGRVCEEGPPEQLLCPAGSYCPAASKVPLSCPKGYYCPEGSPYPKPCPEEGICPEGVEEPLLCPAGAYRATSESCVESPSTGSCCKACPAVSY